MPIIQVLRLSIALLFAFVLGAIGLVIMFKSELNTAEHFRSYFQWAFGAGLVFLGVGAALTAFDKDDNVVTPFDEQQAKK
jgi:hypothetical protein